MPHLLHQLARPLQPQVVRSNLFGDNFTNMTGAAPAAEEKKEEKAEEAEVSDEDMGFGLFD